MRKGCELESLIRDLRSIPILLRHLEHLLEEVEKNKCHRFMKRKGN